MRRLRAAVGVVLGVVARLWLSTLDVSLDVHPSLSRETARPWILAFFHGRQWPLLAWKRRRPTVVMVSLSRDGDMQARALSVLGFEIVRGSSSRGGARGLAAIVRRLKAGAHDAAFAVDGPRGPIGAPKPGVLLAARRAGALLVPMGSAVASGKVFHRAWDRFALAWPFTRVAVVLGAPIALSRDDLSGEARDAAALAEAIEAANASAEAMVAL